MRTESVTRGVVLVGLLMILAALLMGCSVLPDRAGAEVEHVSHPLAGYPFGPASAEDTINQVNAFARWQVGDRGYVDHALGYNLGGSNGGGFYGPGLTYTCRVGVELWKKDQRR